MDCWSSELASLEHFDWVTAWVFDEDLGAARAADRLVPEDRSGLLKVFDGNVEVWNFNDNPVPAAGGWDCTVGHWLGCGSLRTADPQDVRSLREDREGGTPFLLDFETEYLLIPCYSLIFVLDHDAKWHG